MLLFWVDVYCFGLFFIVLLQFVAGLVGILVKIVVVF